MTDNTEHVMTREEMRSVHEAFVRATEEQNIVLASGKVWTDPREIECEEPSLEMKNYLAYRDNQAACAFWELSNFITKADTLDEVKVELARLEKRLREMKE